MSEDIIRVLRIVEYVGPRSEVEQQIEKSIHGTRRFGNGLGCQDRSNATRDDVWASVSGAKLTDYAMPTGDGLSPRADYVFGRMMKLGLKILPDGIDWRDHELRRDYQAWCGTFPSYQILFEAAVISLAKTREQVTQA